MGHRASQRADGLQPPRAEARVDAILPYTEQTAREHARIWAQLEAASKMIGYFDIIVAATALARGSEVATFNKRHFDALPGLTTIEPK